MIGTIIVFLVELLGHVWDFLRKFVPGNKTLIGIVAILGFFTMILYSIFLAPPRDFSGPLLIHLKQGTTLSQAAQMLEDRHIINSVFVFKVINKLLKRDATVVAGEYSFSEPQNILTITERLINGDFELQPVKITVVEGMDTRDIAAMLKKQLPDFDSDTFYKLAAPKEGHLFPDTYFLLPGSDPDLVLSAMTQNFDAQIRDVHVAAAIEIFGKPLPQVLTMASLLEKEASKTQDRRIISGILWGRIASGMKLQVDAVFPYLLGKNTFELTTKDLEVDSPYNTYRYAGLPPGPIDNPSLDAILAAVEPIKTPYVYYLSDKNGTMHYATTYAQHLANKSRFLGS